MINITVSDEPIDIIHISNLASDHGSGAVNMFIGSVRNKTQNKDVIRLEYEAYEGMARKVMDEIANVVVSKWHVNKIVIHHRVGKLMVGEAAVVIAVSTPHRQDSFSACQFIIDTLKQKVPIWKKEIFMDGEEWVSAHP